VCPRVFPRTKDLRHEAKAKDLTRKAKTKDFKIVLGDSNTDKPTLNASKIGCHRPKLKA